MNRSSRKPRTMILSWSFLLFWVLLATELGAQQGYRIEGDLLTVAGSAAWRAWDTPIGSEIISTDGVVTPRFVRRNINAVLNAAEFETAQGRGDTVAGGVRSVGISSETAAFAMDGDPTTFWDPHDADSLQSWFIELDLGRAVVASRVVVRFADEGDPFLKFRVLLSNGSKPVTESLYDKEFFRVGQVTSRNKTQRLFEFDVPPQRPTPPGVTGEVAQFVRLEALDTDGPRGEELGNGKDEYDALAPDDQGAIEHFRKTVAGRLILVEAESYENLPDEERGPVVYYRHERPRVAEIEVHSLGDNVVGVTQRIQNKNSDLFADIVLSTSTDGRYTSFYPLRVYDPLQDRNQVVLNLGAKFWLDRIRLLAAREPLTAYQVRISDGSLDPTGDVIWEAFDERHNRESFLQLEERFPLQEVQLIELRRLELLGSRNETGNLSEIQAYGEGFVSEVTLTSPIIKTETSRIFTGVEWEGETPEGTHLEVRTRSGNDVLEVKEYFDLFNRSISEEQWNSTTTANRGPVVSEELPGPDWSNWSEPYRASGTGGFLSPSPRRLAMVQVRLLTADARSAASIRQVQLGMRAPLVEQSFAEIWPNAGVQPGEIETFDIYIKPLFQAGDDGFDRLRIRSSSVAPMELMSLRSGSDGQLQQDGGRQLFPGVVEVEEPSEIGGIELAFPEIISSGAVTYKTQVQTKLFLSGTTFAAELINSNRPEVVQVISEGNANDLVASDLMVVVANVEGAPVLEPVKMVPPVFSPNGDGTNDETSIQFSVFRIRGEQWLQVRVYDLTGRQVRDLSARRENPSGEHGFTWDGLNEEGRLVPPGSYLIRVEVETDANVGRDVMLGVVGVAY